MKFIFYFLSSMTLAAPCLGLGIVFSDSSVTATGGTVGGTVHWFVAGQFLDQGLTVRFQDIETVIDTDLNGDSHWPQEHTVPALSVWLAVDATTGEFAVGSPGNLDARSTAFPTASLLENAELAFELTRAQLLWIRPGSGAWQGRGVDGGRRDSRASEPGVLAFALADLESLGQDVVPSELLPGDRLALLDSNRLTLAVMEVTEAWLAAAASQGDTGGTEKGGR